MLSRSLRPVTARVSNLATNPIRSAVFPGHFSIRTIAIATDVTTSIPEPATTPSTSEAKAPRVLPYFIGRNNFGAIPAYHREKRGGNLKLTILKRAEGDLMALKQDLKAALQLSDDEVSINSKTRHIVVDGHKRLQVLNFVKTMGF
ncbi:mitochondrial large subunit ribosomal protein-domain-containing protein [Xylaria bambusicola]|uniref:mitochondrial large subunit ribosomal protein-domain-containing protein n=1 Tax=Xylaria bambusicola TaxID=326684 RepID=UPI002008713E|nr:mitochondrial large subunit ribosomal protein-domain-containing protein [Xylaria bambusicola]KAI0517773.1 mitochondrial large subunit ribosomal protein-domain-containing protein [Xylaria bambusicola]